MKKFDIPEIYKSSIINRIKEKRKNDDPRKKDFSPTELDFGSVKFYIARHFGFSMRVGAPRLTAFAASESIKV